jgi:outer membrane lipoprotein SlyB
MQVNSKFAKTGLALTLAATLGVAAAPVAASAQSYGSQSYGQTKDTPFTCATPGGKQEGGAVIGALLGGLLGSKVSKNERTAGALVGAGLGAAAGGYIGCKAQSNDADQRGTYVRDGYRLASYVQPASFQRAGGRFIATSTVTLRAAPSTRAGRLGTLTRGETFQAMAYTQRGQWVLVGQNGVGIGYVSSAYVRPTGYSQTRW